MAKKPLILLLLLMAIVVASFFYLYTDTGHCNFKTAHFPIPPFLRDIQIKFNVEPVYVPKAYTPCDTYIIRQLYFNGYVGNKREIMNKIPSHMEFTVVDYFQTDPREHFDGPQIDTYLVVKDQNGVESLFSIYVLEWLSAGYYRNGKRIADADPKQLEDPLEAQKIKPFPN